MATKIFDAESITSEGVIMSTEMTDVGDLVLDCEISDTLPNGKSIDFTVYAKEGSNSYKPIEGDDGAIRYSFAGNGRRISILGVNAEYCKLYATIPSGLTGTLTVEKTQSTNPNA